MKRIIYLFLISTALLLSGCYKDKGNYDYKDIQPVDIVFEDNYMDLVFGETLLIKPTLSREIDLKSGNYTIHWYVGDEQRTEWDNKVAVEWQIDRILKSSKIIMNVIDNRNNMKYSNYIHINVTGPFESSYSWMILSDNGGKSQLSYFACVESDGDTRPGHTLFKKTHFYEDAYSSANGSTTLGTGPICLREHFREAVNWKDEVVGNVFVFQKSGAVDLSGVDFKKSIDMNEAFNGGSVPEGVILYPGTTMDYVELLSDQNGHLYKRVKRSNTVFNSEYFLTTPLENQDEVMEKCMVCRGFYRSNRTGYAVIYDGKNHRMLYVKNPEPEYDWTTGKYDSFIRDAGRMYSLPAAPKDVDLKKVIPLNDFSGYDVMAVEMYQDNLSYDAYGFFILARKISDNTLWIERMVLKGSNGSPSLMKLSLTQVQGVPQTPSKFAFPIYETQEYAFFAVGNVLYRVDLLNASTSASIYYTFDSNITALNNKSWGNEHLAVGLENGDFYILDVVEAKNLSQDQRVIYKAPQKVGKIVDIQYKQLDHWNY